MKRPSVRGLKAFVSQQLRLKAYLQAPGDGRTRPQLPARVLLWSQLACLVLREVSYHAMESLVRSAARSALGVGRRFGDDPWLTSPNPWTRGRRAERWLKC
jgi:hypothetical protein